MKKLMSKRGLRLTALILLVLFLLVGAFGSGVVRYGIKDRWYRPDTYDFTRTNGCMNYVEDACWYVVDNIGVLSWDVMDTLSSYAGRAFSYVITNSQTGVVYVDTRTESSRHVTTVGTVDAISGVAYNVDGYVNLPVEMYDGCYKEYIIYDLLFNWRFAIAAVTLIMLVLAVAMILFASVSVYRAGKGGGLRLVTWVPMDAFLILWSVLSFLLFTTLRRAFYRVVDYYTNSVGFGSILENCVETGIGFFCVAIWLSMLLYLSAGQLGAKSMKERLLITMVSRKVPLGWLVFSIVAANGLLISLYYFFGREGMILFGLVILDFIILLFVIRFVREGNRVRKGAEELAAGNLSYKTDVKRLHSIWWSIGGSLNQIGDGMSTAVEERMKSERMKTELITNVSHDLKTPLTSIINYVQLLKDDSLAPEVKREYLEILDRQSAKLKKLTEDVVEASKAASGVLTIRKERLNAGELLEQSVGEYEARMRAANLEPIVQLPDESVFLMADSAMLGRVLENLMTNIVKYGQSGTRVYFDLHAEGESVLISAKNISREPLNITADELMERFVRGDSSRHSEGSGLGLSIARSLTELMGGSLDIVLDGDLFKAEITFPRVIDAT